MPRGIVQPARQGQAKAQGEADTCGPGDTRSKGGISFLTGWYEARPSRYGTLLWPRAATGVKRRSGRKAEQQFAGCASDVA
eukprot:scaffold25297_cov40-Tisochrysis_lutea.AAC.3